MSLITLVEANDDTLYKLEYRLEKLEKKISNPNFFVTDEVLEEVTSLRLEIYNYRLRMGYATSKFE